MTPGTDQPGPTRPQLRRWRRYLADELAEAAAYRELALRRSGEERAILLGLADAEERHASHWLSLLPEDRRTPQHPSWRSRALALLARRFGFVFALAMAGRAETRSDYDGDPDVPASMVADERIHAEVVRGLATRGRARLSGNFRAAVFGANDGLVSNLSLVLGIGATGTSGRMVLVTGVAGLLAGALSMAAGEYVSVRSQRELFEASTPDPTARSAVADLNLEANELALVYRTRGLTEAAAATRAAQVLAGSRAFADPTAEAPETIGTGLGAALSSFCFFAAGAVIPVIPYAIGLSGLAAVAWSAGLVGVALLLTGGSVGLLSGASPAKRGLRQLAIGYGAAAVTYAIGTLFNVTAA